MLGVTYLLLFFDDTCNIFFFPPFMLYSLKFFGYFVVSNFLRLFEKNIVRDYLLKKKLLSLFPRKEKSDLRLCFSVVMYSSECNLFLPFQLFSL